MDDVVLSFDEDSASGRTAARSASDPWASGSNDSVDAPAGLQQPPMSADEAADVAEDEEAIRNGTMARIEEEVAAEAARCPQGPDSTYWEDVNPQTTVDRRVPVHFDALRTKFTHRFEWEQTKRTSMSIAVTGKGNNYAGGMAFSIQQEESAGAANTKSNAGETHQWFVEWRYKKQARWCYNMGYPYKLGRTRWVPRKWTNGFTQAENLATTFTCKSANQARVEGDLWVMRANSSTWNGWFQIAGVKLDASQTRSDANEIKKDNLRIKATYLRRGSVDHGFLCGRGDRPTSAPFAEEVLAP